MMRYRVHGHTTVNVVAEVEAHSEKEAYKKASNVCGSLVAYCGNGGLDKLVGVTDPDACVDVLEGIEYDDIEKI